MTGSPPAARGRIGLWIFAGVLLASVLVGAAMLGLSLSRQTIGILVIALSILLLLLGLPVGIAMLGAGLLGLYAMNGPRVAISTMKSVAYDSTASWSYSVIPMFILMGMILWKTGLTSAAYDTARRWLGWLPGGLAVATNFAGAILAASSGSTIGITYALGRVSIPEMLKSGYHPRLAVGSVAAAGTLGQIIPPSLLLVIYAGAASVPIGPQLLAGIVPGILLAIAFATTIIGWAILFPASAPRQRGEPGGWPARLRSLAAVAPVALIVLIVVGGLFLGVATATEAGVFGMLAALIFGVLHQRRQGTGWRAIGRLLRDSAVGTLTGTAAIFLLIIGVAVLSRVMALSQVPNALAGLIVGSELGRIELLLILILVYMVLGMFMDTLAMMLLTIPVLLVPLQAVGVDPLWFGVFLVVMAEVGLLTPPLGILAFIVHRIADDPETNLGRPISLTTVFQGVAPFAATALVVLVALILMPGLVTWLPGASLGG
ncbi:TRAP transporter large permease [Pararhodobacter aggregans]|uniref:C4-dicarboxylate ABC transporter permease n=1 Tax=Pararhodobacter aggregans TaxID=404875 RepID=A0A2T7UV32_9RHOB|nr:TRAP transporter large permease [Pararhodobacter aggregans]PTX04107.1 tripartite ATP-independent transporter DctM subunit [Pararhodobacter aggregans]PVE48429.1 C4-dicarboxylate ABC transporter permease [Pararhodobacter aggregans]